MQFHNVSDLLWNGCDTVADPFGLDCRVAVGKACEKLGYAGGGGLVEKGLFHSSGLCIRADAGSPLKVNYSGGCTSSTRSSVFCDSLAQRACLARGFATSTGVIGASEEGVEAFCLKASLAGVVTSSFSEAFAANTSISACTDAAARANESSCDHNAVRVCRAKGYSSGFGVVEAGATDYILSCAHVEVLPDVSVSTRTGFEKALTLGENVVGGYIIGLKGDDTAPAETLVNAFPYPVLVRNVEYGSNYDGRFGYSRDVCLYLNRDFIGQFDDNDDGEVGCTYSDVRDIPSQNFKDLGMILRPGERLIFHGTPQWGKSPEGMPLATGASVWAKIEISKVVEGALPVRRIRFPKHDTIYPVGTDKLFIAAGNESDTPVPYKGAPGKPLKNTNWWFVAPRDTHIRGMTIFMSQGQPDGAQGVSACLRVVLQGGEDWATPRCFSFYDERFGPHTFNRVFGAEQKGSALVRFDQPVPAGALIGIDFEFSTVTPTNLDFAGYVWLQE